MLKTAQRWLKPKKLIQLEGRGTGGGVGWGGGAGVFEQLAGRSNVLSCYDGHLTSPQNHQVFVGPSLKVMGNPVRCNVTPLMATMICTFSPGYILLLYLLKLSKLCWRERSQSNYIFE